MGARKECKAGKLNARNVHGAMEESTSGAFMMNGDANDDDSDARRELVGYVTIIDSCSEG